MKVRLLLLATLVFSMLATSYGQVRGGRERRARMSPEQRLQRLTSALSLTDDQQAKIKPMLQDEQEQIQKIRQGSGDRQSKMEQARDVRQATNQKIRGVLTDEQKKKFTELQKQMQQEMREKRGGQPQGGDDSISNN